MKLRRAILSRPARGQRRVVISLLEHSGGNRSGVFIATKFFSPNIACLAPAWFVARPRTNIDLERRISTFRLLHWIKLCIQCVLAVMAWNKIQPAVAGSRSTEDVFWNRIFIAKAIEKEQYHCPFLNKIVNLQSTEIVHKFTFHLWRNISNVWHNPRRNNSDLKIWDLNHSKQRSTLSKLCNRSVLQLAPDQWEKG